MTESTSFADMLAESEPRAQRARRAPKVGDMVKGEIVAMDADQVFVAIGGKSEAVLDLANVTAEDGSLNVRVGETIEARITSIDAETGVLRLGQRHGRAAHGLEELEAAYRAGAPVEGQILAAIKGGVEVQIAGQRAFCPASQLDVRFIEDLSTLVGQREAFRITKFSAGRRPDLVVSRRALLEEAQAEAAAATRAKLEVGAVLTGTVTRVKDFGAFVDLGGLEGMVHVSELAHAHVRHPEEILSPGQVVEVAVLRIEHTTDARRPEKVALSIRALAADPWSEVASRFPVGTTLQGKVTRLQAFGAFVELVPGLEGLIHIGELGAGRRIAHPGEVVQPGQSVAVRVLAVEPERRRVALTLAEAEAEASAPGPAKKPAAPAMGTLGALLRAQLDKR